MHRYNCKEAAIVLALDASLKAYCDWMATWARVNEGTLSEYPSDGIRVTCLDAQREHPTNVSSAASMSPIDGRCLGLAFIATHCVSACSPIR